MRPVENGINWEIVGREGFEKTVESLLSRVHDGDRIEFPEGRGGDGGRDAIVYTADGRTIVYQFKFYPDGLATSANSRRRAVENSFKTALDHEPDEWVLVFPGKMTDAFRRLVLGFARGKKVKVTYVDRPRLDSLLAEHGDLVDLLKQDDLLMERARVLGHEPLLLKRGVKDAMDFRAALVNSLDRLHPYWGLRMQEVNGIPTFTPYAKTANAQERSPLGLKVGVKVNKSDPLANDLRNALDFGHPSVVIIPGSSIAGFQWTGDFEWMGVDEGHPDELEFHTASIAALEGASVRITTYDEHGKPTGSHRGTARGGGRGLFGASLVMDFYGCVTLTALIPEAEGATGTIQQTMDVAGSDPSLVRKAVSLLLAVGRPHRVEIAVNDQPLCAIGVHRERTVSDRDNLIALLETARDLEAVQDRTGVYFSFPSQVGDLDRIWLRCVCLLLEGKATYVPRSVFTGRANGGAPTTDIPEDGERRAVVLDTPASVLEIFGQSIPIPGARFYHPDAEVKGARDSRADLDAGISPPREFTMRATGNGFYMAYMPSTYREEAVIAVPWQLTGVKELPAIAPNEIGLAASFPTKPVFGLEPVSRPARVAASSEGG